MIVQNKVMTSNMGAEVVRDLPDTYKGNEPEVQTAMMDIVARTLSPELLNRIDEKIIFNRLQRQHMNVITGEFFMTSISVCPSANST